MRPALVSLLALALAGCATPQTGRTGAEAVTVGIIAFNDFHGRLEPLDPAGSKGGAANLARTIERMRADNPNSVTVTAGDLIGASPLVSSLYMDEPTIGVMNRIGLDLSAVGNHEFDSGTAELRRKQAGGCERHTLRQPCQIEQFAGASFGFLAANVKLRDGAGTLFPATALRTFGKGRRKVTVGFIGMTLEGTPGLVAAQGIADVRFDDEADTANALVPGLKAQGADAIVLLIHEGAYPAPDTDPNACDGLSGDIQPILERLDPAIDVVVSGHTHKAYVCEIATAGAARPRLLTSAGQYGSFVTGITLAIDPARGTLISRSARNVAVEHENGESATAAPPAGRAAEVAAYVARYADAVRDIAARSVGRLSASVSRNDNGTGGTLGNIVADAQLAATRQAGAQIALTNPYGLRAPITPAADGTVSFAQAYAAQPFANVLVTRTLTGAQLKALIEQGLGGEGRMQALAPSAGLAYTFDLTRAAGDRLVTLTFMGKPVAPDELFRVSANAFIDGGGDGLTIFAQGTDRVVSGSDLDALESWFAAAPVRDVPADDRVKAVAKR